MTDAFWYKFGVAVVEECVYDRAEVSHTINLWNMNSEYADVISFQQTRELLSGLEHRV